ncbi:12013_t:CDS:2 [Funneliformis geosporum]|nr:12013_t:CDS:2 [Funneliformis geosporum]
MEQYSNYGGQQDPSSGSYSSYPYGDSYNQGGYTTAPTSSSSDYYYGNNPPAGGNNSSSSSSTTQQQPPATTQGYASQRNDNYEGSGYSSGYNNSYGNYPAPTTSGSYQAGQSSSAGSSTAAAYNSGSGSYGGSKTTGYADRSSDYGDSSSYGGNKNPYGDSYSYKPRENDGREGGYSGPPSKEGGSYDSYGSRSDGGYKDNFVDDSVVQTINDTVYISNLSKDVTEEKLAEKFGSLGMLKIDRKTQKPKIWIYYDKVTGLPKGDATITYEDADSTAAAIKYFDNQKFLDQVIKVEMSVRKISTSGFRARARGRGRVLTRGSRGGPPPRDGDWACESCSANNFARRMECYKCHTPRANASGEGGYGGGRYSGAPRGGYRGRRGGPPYSSGSGRYGDDDRGYGGGGYRNSDSSHGYEQGYGRQNKQDDRQDRRDNSRYRPY